MAANSTSLLNSRPTVTGVPSKKCRVPSRSLGFNNPDMSWHVSSSGQGSFRLVCNRRSTPSPCPASIMEFTRLGGKSNSLAHIYGAAERPQELLERLREQGVARSAERQRSGMPSFSFFTMVNAVPWSWMGLSSPLPIPKVLVRKNKVRPDICTVPYVRILTRILQQGMNCQVP